MLARKNFVAVIGAAILIVSLTACAEIISPPALDLDVVPVYTGAERIDPATNVVTAAVYREDLKQIANGHKSESKAYALPKGTTSTQVKEFYLPRLPQLGGDVESWMEDNAPMGSIFLHRGPQDITIEYDNMSGSPTPILLIESFIVNGCAGNKAANCVTAPEMIRTCPSGMKLKTEWVSRQNYNGNGTVSTETFYCVGPDGTQVAPTNSYPPTPNPVKP